MENLIVLDEPFSTAFLRGDSIDYKLVKGAKKTDHDIASEHGYEPEMASDCSYNAVGLPSFSLSSYGDWGSFYPDMADNESKDMFLMMVKENIIKPWRISAYRKDGTEVKQYHYNNVNNVWTVYDKAKEDWVETCCPYGN